MVEFFTYLVAGLALGASFALIASGFVVVYRVTHVVNFTQGTYAVVASFATSSLLAANVPHGLSELLAILLAGVVGVLVGLVAIGKPGTPPGISLVITIGLSIFAYAILILVWGDAPVSFAGIPGVLRIGTFTVPLQSLAVILATIVAFALMAALFERTMIGKGLTASASNPRAARLVGIDVRRMGLLAFGLAGMLGGVAGVLITPLREMSYDSDMLLVLSGFAAAVFGGLTSPWKAAAGGLFLGVLGTMVAGYFSGSHQTEIALLAMVIVMVIRGSRGTLEEAK